MILLSTLLFAVVPAGEAQTTPLKMEGGWALNGMVEPDTSLDRDGGYMWSGPDTNVTGRRVYFQGFQTSDSTILGGSANNNLAMFRTAAKEYPATRMWAALGVWKDCNADGYIGLGDHALLEYPVQLLDAAGSDRCKPEKPPKSCQGNTPPLVPNLVCWITYGWEPSHNDGKWVHEFIPISWDAVEALGQDTYKVDTAPYDFNDTGARVWADWNLPTDPPSLQCFVRPQQPGTWQSTGGMIAYGDCQTHFRIVQTQSNVANQSSATRPYALNQRNGEYIGNHNPEASSSPLNQKNPWGDPSAPAAFTAWDCSNPIVQEMTVAGQQVAVGDRWVGVPRPKAPNTSPTPGWSIAGQVNETDNAFADCKRHDKATQERGSLGDTMYCPGDGNLIASQPQTQVCESKTKNTVGLRTRPDYTLTPPRRAMPNGLVDPRVSIIMDDMAQPGNPLSYSTAMFWSSNTSTTYSRNPYIKKEDLQPRDKQWMVWYAYVTPGKYNLIIPGKPTGYGNGAGQCGVGYECDASQWWPGDSMPRSSLLGRDPASCFPAPPPGGECNGANDKYQPGHPQEGQTLSKEDNLKRERAPYGRTVGDPFNLRDVDCWDNGATIPVKQGPLDHPRVAPGALLANGGSPCS